MYNIACRTYVLHNLRCYFVNFTKFLYGLTKVQMLMLKNHALFNKNLLKGTWGRDFSSRDFLFLFIAQSRRSIIR
jgi:hypothetical protein